MENNKIVYQGVAGSYSYEALINIYGKDCDKINVDTFEDVFKAIENKTAKYGVLPIENSSTGPITEVVDLLNKYNCYIVYEKTIKIEHSLLAIEGATLDSIEKVYSHPQGFLQSKQFLDNYRQWEQRPYYNTAMSVKYVKEANKLNYAAIGSKNAAEIYGLKVLKEKINTNDANYTRFVVISNDCEITDEANKISVSFSLPHVCGSLQKIINVIYIGGLSMIKIESRPIFNKPWEYRFYVDFEGNINMKKVQGVLNLIEENATNFRMLGNYIANI